MKHPSRYYLLLLCSVFALTPQDVSAQIVIRGSDNANSKKKTQPEKITLIKPSALGQDHADEGLGRKSKQKQTNSSVQIYSLSEVQGQKSNESEAGVLTIRGSEQKPRSERVLDRNSPSQPQKIQLKRPSRSISANNTGQDKPVVVSGGITPIVVSAHGVLEDTNVSAMNSFQVRSPANARRNIVQTVPEKKKQYPVNLNADRLQHDDFAGVIRASGNVELKQNGRSLKADEVIYYLNDDRALARGAVLLTEANGDQYWADEVEFTDELKDGFVKGLSTYLVNGSRFKAKDGLREDGVRTIMEEASYTPCEPCRTDPKKAPLWQIKASEVKHDEEEHRVYYEDASFEVMGVPVAYSPYFSHPDGTVKRKSGFINPEIGFDSELGASFGTSYYWDLAPNKDMTIGMVAYTDVNPLVTGQWRQSWENASLVADVGLTYSDRQDQVAGQEVAQENEVRGHIFANGLWDMNDKWRNGINIQYASDDQYLRQYDFSSEDVLENEIYTERFSGRNYASGRLITFQDVRVGDEQEDQPEVLPEIIASFIGEPGSMPLIGGRWDIGTSMIGVIRTGDEQDMNRLSIAGGWEKRMIAGNGIVTDFDVNMRGDFYHIRDQYIADNVFDRSAVNREFRLYPQAHIQSSYPLARNFENNQVVIEPIAALTLAPNINLDSKIPNEDSQDVQIDSSNLFEANRFPGLDSIEDKSRITYGLRTGLYNYRGSFISVFGGQSMRFDDDDSPFPEGSGLDSKDSDYVSEITANYKDRYRLNYRNQLASDNLTSVRHEVDAYADWGRFALGSQYLFAKGLDGTDVDQSREQIQGSAAYYLSPDWRFSTTATQDLGTDPGLRRATAGLDYYGQCLSWSMLMERNLTSDTSGDSSTEFMFRIGLKTLGDFAVSEYQPSVSSSDNANNRAEH